MISVQPKNCFCLIAFYAIYRLDNLRIRVHLFSNVSSIKVRINIFWLKRVFLVLFRNYCQNQGYTLKVCKEFNNTLNKTTTRKISRFIWGVLNRNSTLGNRKLCKEENGETTSVIGVTTFAPQLITSSSHSAWNAKYVC